MLLLVSVLLSAQLFMAKLLKWLERTRTLPSQEADSPTPTPTPICEARNSLSTTELYHPTPSKMDMGTTKNERGSVPRGKSGHQSQTWIGIQSVYL